MANSSKTSSAKSANCQSEMVRPLNGFPQGNLSSVRVAWQISDTEYAILAENGDLSVVDVNAEEN